MAWTFKGAQVAVRVKFKWWVWPYVILWSLLFRLVVRPFFNIDPFQFASMIELNVKWILDHGVIIYIGGKRWSGQSSKA